MESKVNYQSELAKSIRVHALLTREMGNIYLHQFNDLPSHQIDDMFDVEPEFPSTFIKKGNLHGFPRWEQSSPEQEVDETKVEILQVDNVSCNEELLPSSRQDHTFRESERLNGLLAREMEEPFIKEFTNLPRHDIDMFGVESQPPSNLTEKGISLEQEAEKKLDVLPADDIPDRSDPSQYIRFIPVDLFTDGELLPSRLNVFLTCEMKDHYIYLFNDLPSEKIDEMFDDSPPKFINEEKLLVPMWIPSPEQEVTEKKIDESDPSRYIRFIPVDLFNEEELLPSRLEVFLACEMKERYIYLFNDLPAREMDKMFEDDEPQTKFPSNFIKKEKLDGAPRWNSPAGTIH